MAPHNRSLSNSSPAIRAGTLGPRISYIPLTSDSPTLPSIVTNSEGVTFQLDPSPTSETSGLVAATIPSSMFDDAATSVSSLSPVSVANSGSFGIEKDIHLVTYESWTDLRQDDIALIKRWNDWKTLTSTVVVTNTQEVPEVVTICTTLGVEDPVTADGGTTTETIYKGASTLTVLGPSYLTLTFYPTTTLLQTSRTTVATATHTKTQDPQRPKPQEPSDTGCLPGDANIREQTGLVPTHDQSITLYVIAISYSFASPGSIVGIAIGWNLYGLRDILYPFKVFTVSIHEIGHVCATIMLGYRIGFFSIDPKLGGATRIYVGNDREHPLPFGALPAGYVFSILIGGILTFCGFNTLASKVASFVIGLCWIAVFLRVGFAAKVMTLGAIALMVGLWFVDHAWPLRLYVLFLGVMSSFYVLWDAADDAFFAKQYPCCPALFYERIPALNPGLWTLVWFLVSFILFVGFVLAGLVTWKQSSHAMRCQADTFLP
ncbi:M50 family metallopeptidase [Sporobolomyces koalae]|uniref:M50 family metallopeptidase n=1 Tax=Sporobolomyces koalae TaxID=500713 RepID=UPI00317964C7